MNQTQMKEAQGQLWLNYSKYKKPVREIQLCVLFFSRICIAAVSRELKLSNTSRDKTFEFQFSFLFCYKIQIYISIKNNAQEFAHKLINYGGSSMN